MLPLLGGEFLAGSNPLVDTVMSTYLPSGSVSILRYAGRIHELPVQVLVLAIARAMFPFISESAARGDFEQLGQIFKRTIVFLSFLTIPITCLVVLFADDIVILLYRRGAFDAYAAMQTAQTLSCYSYGLFFFAYTFVNFSFFSALKHTRPLFYMGLITVTLNFVFDVLFMRMMGVSGIALSTTVTFVIIVIIFVAMLRRRLLITDLSEVYVSIFRVVLVSLAMYGVGFLLLKCCQSIGLSRLVYFPTIAPIIYGCYVGALWRIGTPELHECMKMLGRMIPGLAGRFS
jgi:putative peptidoglycan lipid II flippase